MQLGQVVGTVVATVKSPTLRGHRVLWVRPTSFEREPDGEAFAAIDLVSAGRGEWVLYVKGREAANALPNPFNPSDRAVVAIVDEVTLEPVRGVVPLGPVRGAARHGPARGAAAQDSDGGVAPEEPEA
jgi:microcompartment protein CcmK/EutM